jgi:hypothetical protein
MNGTAFWVLVWVFTVEHPNGEITEHSQSYANKYTFAECLEQRDEFTRIIWLKDITPDGGDAIDSRFVCVPVPG